MGISTGGKSSSPSGMVIGTQRIICLNRKTKRQCQIHKRPAATMCMQHCNKTSTEIEIHTPTIQKKLDDYCIIYMNINWGGRKNATF